MVTANDLYKLLNMSDDEVKLLGESLVWFSDSMAERIKNSIMVAQQERDLAFLEQEKQNEEASRMADMDSQHYGERV